MDWLIYLKWSAMMYVILHCMCVACALTYKTYTHSTSKDTQKTELKCKPSLKNQGQNGGGGDKESDIA